MINNLHSTCSTLETLWELKSALMHSASATLTRGADYYQSNAEELKQCAYNASNQEVPVTVETLKTHTDHSMAFVGADSY